jgi:hypothetical protein
MPHLTSTEFSHTRGGHRHVGPLFDVVHSPERAGGGDSDFRNSVAAYSTTLNFKVYGG